MSKPKKSEETVEDVNADERFAVSVDELEIILPEDRDNKD